MIEILTNENIYAEDQILKVSVVTDMNKCLSYYKSLKSCTTKLNSIITNSENLEIDSSSLKDDPR